MKKFKTTIFAKAELVETHSDKFKSIASQIKDKYGFDLQPQMDLLYVKSCLVSAGNRAGINHNDDIFTAEEAWAARKSPVLKPLNWQHDDKDIVGVMYTVQAQDLEGNILDFDSEEPPADEFDLVTEAVIFRLIHAERAQEVEQRTKAGDLFVSMEAWFDDYHYGLCDSTGNLSKIVARNEDTSFLDKHLRSCHGTGTYRDPESGQDMRIGRVLRSVTFGGCGLVDNPANERSDIYEVNTLRNVASPSEDQLDLLLRQVLDSESSKEEVLMNTVANNEPTKKVDIEAAVGNVLDQRDQQKAEADRTEALENRATAAEAKNVELQAQVDSLSEANEAKTNEVQILNDQLEAFHEVVDDLVKTEAGATDSTPAEIASIDNASDGDAAFKAKIAWLGSSSASLRVRAERADELETDLATASAIVRQREVEALLGGYFDADVVEAFVSHASELDTPSYDQWRAEKELMLMELSKATDDKLKDKTKDKKKGKNPFAKDDDKSEASLFERLLEEKRAAAGPASPDTPPYNPELIGSPGGDGIKSGVNSGQLKTPRFKIAGSATGNDLTQEFEFSVQADGDLNLAGASVVEGEGETVNPFKSLASEITGVGSDKNDEADNTVSFDPVL